MDFITNIVTLIAFLTFISTMYNKFIKHKSFKDLLFIISLLGAIYLNFIHPKKNESSNTSLVDTTKNKSKPPQPLTMSSKNGDNNYAQVSGSNNAVAVGTNAKVIVHKHKTTFVKEDISHPTNALLKQIIDSTDNKGTPIYIRYETSQAVKNRAFGNELLNKLKSLGYNNVSLSDPSNIMMWGISEKTVIIHRGGNNVFLFVTEY